MQTLTSGVSACDSPIMSASGANVPPPPHVEDDAGAIGNPQLAQRSAAIGARSPFSSWTRSPASTPYCDYERTP